MDLNTVKEVKRPESADAVIWRDGYAWLAGGTWLFSEPQLAIDTLIDLETLHWPALHSSENGLDIAATCRIVELDRFAAPPQWTAAPLLRECCRSLLASFKIWNAATVGGNICMSLPVGPMISLTVALGGRSLKNPFGEAIVTGDARYTLDIAMGEVLHLKVLRSPHPHARIRVIDRSKAMIVPGVIDIFTESGPESPAPSGRG